MTNLFKHIVETYTNPTELYFTEDNMSDGTDGWRHVDSLEYHCRRKLQREIEDLEFWIPRQADREAKAAYWANLYRKQYTGDEISTNNLKASAAKWKAEAFGLRVMESELAKMQKAYKKHFGMSYTSIKAQPDAEIPEDIASTLAEMDSLSKAS
tara:strand:- start:117 stop:578 length:462 start_codon:yes stop_codon:yes gene_type:complete